MRISNWVTEFNAEIIPYQGDPGDSVYRLVDLFTTRDGSWEPSEKPGSVPQWARSEYLKPFGHPQYNDDGGADHHLFGAVRGEYGALIPSFPIVFWTYDDNRNRTVQQAKRHGWANIVTYSSSSFSPERGERGPWAWQPASVNADIVVGGGLPANWHVSWFAVWEPTTITTPPDDESTDERLAQRVDALERNQVRLERTLKQWAGELMSEL